MNSISFDEALQCITEDDVDRLHNCLCKDEYRDISFNKQRVNKKEENLLHYACRKCKANAIEYLLSNSVCSPLSVDYNGNTPLHLLLKSILLIDSKQDFIKAYKRLVLANLQDFAPSLHRKNIDGETAKELLELADSILKYHSETNKKARIGKKAISEKDWNRKLAEEVEDEYCASWGKYEEDFCQEEIESESYDKWADRILHEHEKKKRPRVKPVTVEEFKWSRADQETFNGIQQNNEKMRQEEIKKTQLEDKRIAFLSKLKLMVQGDGRIEKSDLPFDYSESTDVIAELILLHVNEIREEETKRRAIRESQRLWHPDKFAQIFGQRLHESIRESVLSKVTEISQYINSFATRNSSKNA